MERSHLDEETIVNHFICHSRPGLGEGLDPTVYFKKYSFSNSQEMENGWTWRYLKGNDSTGGTHFSLNHDYGRKGTWMFRWKLVNG